jgi:hypothetical protein
MWARLRRFNALPRPARALFVRAALLLPLITLSLGMRGFRRTQHFLQRFLGSNHHLAQGVAIEPLVALTCRMVLTAARHSPIPSTCLERSLSIWWLLGRQGIASQLRIGVQKEAEKLQAHAWVEREGVAIGEPESSHLHYAPFSSEFSGDLK